MNVSFEYLRTSKFAIQFAKIIYLIELSEIERYYNVS